MKNKAMWNRVQLVVMSWCFFMLFAEGMSAQVLRNSTRRLLPPASSEIVATKEKVAVVAPSEKLKVKKIDTFPQSLKFSTGISPLIKNPKELDKLESFIYRAIQVRAFPGCQIFAIKDGNVVYNRSFGTFDYQGGRNVKNNSLYDIASVTKIAATTMAIMKLYEEGKIRLDAKLGAYLPKTLGTNKSRLRISNLLTHQAGLKSWIPFYKYTLDSISKKPTLRYYSTIKRDQYSIPIATDFYGKAELKDTIWNRIFESPVDYRKRYVYSDLDLLFLEQVVVQQTGMPLDKYVQKHFFSPMQLANIMYNPWKKKLEKRCPPTENDRYFRMRKVQGYVHDQCASMLGGVAGHAGLFANAQDLAAVMQMLLDGGVYNGRRYLKEQTIKKFTGYKTSKSRRGYGFDKPSKEAGEGGPASDLCSKLSFGHQGFTGTCAWADPKHGIVYVFLSNRVYPSAENKLINRMNIRTKSQAYIYKALGIQN